jgi:RNA polymerase sigma-70 factor (ECF subfamily)
VQSALNQLTDDFRAPVVLRDLLGYDYAEIASILDIRPGTVRSRIARGRAALREILGNQRPSANVQVDDHEWTRPKLRRARLGISRW